MIPHSSYCKTFREKLRFLFFLLNFSFSFTDRVLLDMEKSLYLWKYDYIDLFLKYVKNRFFLLRFLIGIL